MSNRIRETFLESEATEGLSEEQIERALRQAFAALPRPGKVLVLPPDITRLNSYAGPIVAMIRRLFPQTVIDLMPALGTHVPMTTAELERMYPGFPQDRVFPHRWRDDIETIGTVPASFMEDISENKLHDPVLSQLNRRLLDPSYDLILSVGQVVPHEVAGMANYNKNIFVGCGGKAIIDASHYLGAVYGMERIMGRDDTPVRKLFNYAEEQFAADLPIVYILTTTARPDDRLTVYSLSVGRSVEGFRRSAEVSRRVNFTLLDKPIRKAVVFLDPDEFRTTWLGNKAIYRTRMAMADDGELIVLAPGLRGCGEDRHNDELIRRYGYAGREQVLRWVESEPDLADNLSVAAHLIHGSSDGRFRITYAPGRVSRDEIESIRFAWMDLDEALRRYPPERLRDGWNDWNGEEIFYVSNPALGLWSDRRRFAQD